MQNKARGPYLARPQSLTGPHINSKQRGAFIMKVVLLFDVHTDISAARVSCTFQVLPTWQHCHYISQLFQPLRQLFFPKRNYSKNENSSLIFNVIYWVYY